MAALCLTTSSLSFKSAPQSMRIDTVKVKLKVKYVKQKNFTFVLTPSAPYLCPFFPISLYPSPYLCPFFPISLSPSPYLCPFFPISLYPSPYPCTFFPYPCTLRSAYSIKKALISVAYRRFTSFPHIPVPFPYFWTFHPISLDFSPHIPRPIGNQRIDLL